MIRNRGIKRCLIRLLKSYLMKISLPKQHKLLKVMVKKMPLSAGNSTRTKLFLDGTRKEFQINHLMNVKNSAKKKHLSNAIPSITQKKLNFAICQLGNLENQVSQDIQVLSMITLSQLEMKDSQMPN